MTEEEADALDELLTRTTPKVNRAAAGCQAPFSMPESPPGGVPAAETAGDIGLNSGEIGKFWV